MNETPEPNPVPDPTADTPALRPTDEKIIPLEPEDPRPSTPVVPVARPASGAGTSRPGVLQLIDDRCPNCGAKMDSDAVVCMACGYDLKANQLLSPETGVEHVEPAAAQPEFVKPGGKPKLLAIAGACVAVAAMAAAAANAPKPGFGVAAGLALVVLYRVVLHTGTGLVGLWCVAKMVGERFTRIDLAASRVLLASSIFWLIVSLHIPAVFHDNWALENLVKWPVAVGCYWLALFALFRRSRQETLIIMLFHFGAAMFVELGVHIAAWLDVLAAPAK